ncbi:substrate-binding domain-containing protein [Diplocloster modestus]|uniref:Substrate-binding domain-containing protein n=1 Tax=Diplocloster modestus TaxID=2850322 RepID=A0ABS6K674_9FIRM|nr:substrate-binding domain-containing protein [Diplocloster modestus]MBU9726024.1 substrate-binding domain-containing protein [Diplocloster modestus]
MKKRTKRITALLMVAMIGVQLTGCASNSGSGTAPADAAAEPAATASSEKAEPQDTPKAAEAADKDAASSGDGFYIEWAGQQYGLSADEIKQVKDMGLRFAIEVPTESDFGYGQIRGFKDTCEALGIETVGEAYCELDPAVQQSNMENFISMGVDAIVCQAQESKIAAKNFDPVVQAGIKLAFTGSVPDGYTAGKEYVTMVSDEFAEEGRMAAEMLADSIGGKGDVLAITISSVNYVSNTRDGAFVDAIKNDYPDINLAEEAGIELASDAGPAISAMLTRHPDAKGVFVTFSAPALEVLEVVKSLNMQDFNIVTIDLDTICCLDMINGGYISGIVCDSAYYYASAAAIALAKSYLGQEVPAELAGPGKKVTPENMEEMWKWSFGDELPEVLKDALTEKGIGA